MRIELFQVLQQSFELCDILRRQVSKGKFVLKIGGLCQYAAGLCLPVRRGDIRLPYPAVGLYGEITDLLLQFFQLVFQLLLGRLFFLFFEQGLQLCLFLFQAGNGLRVITRLDEFIDGGNVRLQFFCVTGSFFGTGGAVPSRPCFFRFSPDSAQSLPGLFRKPLSGPGKWTKYSIPVLGSVQTPAWGISFSTGRPSVSTWRCDRVRTPQRQRKPLGG